MSKLKIYADGGCRGNQNENNLGAYAFVILNNDKILYKEAEAYKDTTNNRMELLGVIKAIKHVNELYPDSSFVLEISSDSSYVCDAFNKGWLDNWVRNNWLNAKKQPVKNKELWTELLLCSKQHSLNFKWVKGHAGNEYNEMCDDMLNIAMNEYNALPKPIVDTDNNSQKDIIILNHLKAIRKELDVLIDSLEK